jgi:hypothetical protein
MFSAGIRIEIAIIAFCLAKWDMDIYSNAAARNISSFMRTKNTGVIRRLSEMLKKSSKENNCLT